MTCVSLLQHLRQIFDSHQLICQSSSLHNAKIIPHCFISKNKINLVSVFDNYCKEPTAETFQSIYLRKQKIKIQIIKSNKFSISLTFNVKQSFYMFPNRHDNFHTVRSFQFQQKNITR